MPAFKEWIFQLYFLIRMELYCRLRRYGALAFIVGTLLTSFLALAICIVFNTRINFTGEYFKGTSSFRFKDND